MWKKQQPATFGSLRREQQQVPFSGFGIERKVRCMWSNLEGFYTAVV